MAYLHKYCTSTSKPEIFVVLYIVITSYYNLLSVDSFPYNDKWQRRCYGTCTDHLWDFIYPVCVRIPDNRSYQPLVPLHAFDGDYWNLH